MTLQRITALVVVVISGLGFLSCPRPPSPVVVLPQLIPFFNVCTGLLFLALQFGIAAWFRNGRMALVIGLVAAAGALAAWGGIATWVGQDAILPTGAGLPRHLTWISASLCGFVTGGGVLAGKWTVNGLA